MGNNNDESFFAAITSTFMILCILIIGGTSYLFGCNKNKEKSRTGKVIEIIDRKLDKWIDKNY